MKWLPEPMMILGAATIFFAILFQVASNKLDAANILVATQKKTLDQQSGLIATLQTLDAQNRALMATQLQREQQLRQQATANERKLRDAIKDDDCAKRDMPGAVVELLQPDTKSGTAAGGTAAP
ncbi:DUF2570 family protein [Serratia fonticola]|uniref:DUF2570 family protein n=1 Tax=Serratia fonticola TaxID=47917 RepID=UPI001AE1F63D|nr:DUF2570 family protein [Serratia fonticola]MBP0999917.1 DUF2570 family protein [Serratia fonticola]MBP1004256.1 DUF2570 family protein [Serratia fonticola]MBP1014248.1 DUF2570 family protein [Serratia fonticola]